MFKSDKRENKQYRMILRRVESLCTAIGSYLQASSPTVDTAVAAKATGRDREVKMCMLLTFRSYSPSQPAGGYCCCF